MTGRHCPIRRKVGDQIGAFEVEVETVWVDKLTKLRPGRAVEVWLTANWCLALCRRPESQHVGTYTREIELRDFREDCFATLEGK